MAIATRKEAREALGAALTTAMTTCEQVNDYFKSGLDGESPVLSIHSLGTLGTPFTFQGLRPTHYFDIVVYVRRGGEGVTEAEAEDELDGVAQQLFEYIEGSRRNNTWESLAYAGRSEAIPIEVGGIPYWQEVTSLEMEVFSG